MEEQRLSGLARVLPLVSMVFELSPVLGFGLLCSVYCRVYFTFVRVYMHMTLSDLEQL